MLSGVRQFLILFCNRANYLSSFHQRLDDLQDLQEQQALLTGKPANNPIYTTEEQQLRWSNLKT